MRIPARLSGALIAPVLLYMGAIPAGAIGLGPAATSGTTTWNAVVVSAAVPATPTLKSVTSAPSGSTAKITLRWTNVANETGYVVERIEDSYHATLAYVTVNGSVGSFTDTRLTLNTRYLCRVRAFNDAGSSDWSNQLTAWTGTPAVPGIVSLTVVRGATSDKVTITWTNVAYETGYVIERASDPLFSQNVNDANSAADTTSKTQSVAKGVTWYYRVRAKNTMGLSEWSKYQSITTP